MAGGIDGVNAWSHCATRLDEGRAVGERLAYPDEHLAIELARLAHILAALPEIELCSAEHVTRIGKHRLAALRQPADVVGMAVSDDDHIDIFRIVAGLLHALDQLPFRHAAAQLLVLVAQAPVAGIEQHELTAGVHERRNERMLKTVGVDAVDPRQILDRARRLIAADARMQPVADDLAVHDVGDLEVAELEAVDRGLQFALHRCGHA